MKKTGLVIDGELAGQVLEIKAQGNKFVHFTNEPEKITVEDTIRDRKKGNEMSSKVVMHMFYYDTLEVGNVKGFELEIFTTKLPQISYPEMNTVYYLKQLYKLAIRPCQK